MLIKILKTKTAASCKLGVKSKEYVAGQSEDIFDDLAEVFIKNGWGVKCEPKIEKSIEKAPENKMFSNEMENKSVELKEKGSVTKKKKNNR